MIPHAEILALRDEWGLRDDVVEKDYVLGWLLAAIAAQPQLRDRWIFKGGTCLRKCFHETYRFSEDLDFTVVDGGPETAEAVSRTRPAQTAVALAIPGPAAKMQRPQLAGSVLVLYPDL